MQNGQPARNRLEIITALVLACCVVLQSMCTLAMHREGSQLGTKALVRKGAEVVVTLIEGFRRGELVGVEADGLVIATESGIDSPWSQARDDNRFTLAFSDIKSVRIIKKMRRISGGLIGALVGIPMGVVAAKASGVEADDMEDAIGKGSLFLLGGMIAGAVAGILLADPLAKDETYVLQGKSDEEIENILIQLRKRTRIEDYQ
jgi:outer membrane lipoprotein SlyB